jgi:prepilin-type N-terminal cleavage/methylation domain-containing protein
VYPQEYFMNPNRPDAGFTLVELSIVLVILGLLVGGVLTGQTLIKAAELRAISTEYNKFITANNAFRDKYFALPGDMTNATSIWGKDNTNCAGNTGTASATGTCNGNGDGSLPYAAAATSTGEATQYWRQLALAGLVDGSFTGLSATCSFCFSIPGSSPTSKMSGAGWSNFDLGIVGSGHPQWFAGTYGNVYFLGAIPIGGTGYTSGGILVPENAYNIDTKIDDGKPATGKVRAWNHTMHPNCTDTDALTAVFTLTDKSTSCALIFNFN